MVVVKEMPPHASALGWSNDSEVVVKQVRWVLSRAEVGGDGGAERARWWCWMVGVVVVL